MKKVWYIILLGFFPFWAWSQTTQEENTGTLDHKINALFEPLVDALGTVFFLDPFGAMGFYDPVIYDEDGKPYLSPEKQLRGKISVLGDQLIGFDTDFTSSDVGAQWVVGDRVLTIKEVSSPHRATLSQREKSPIFKTTYGEVSKVKMPLVVLWLCCGAIFFTLVLRFINFRKIKHAIQLVQGKFDKPGERGEVSHFQALTTALSATVGLGNIASVAVAISVGGPGATFWMILVGILGMSLKFAECTMGVKYRRINSNGSISGGPMYYLKYGLAARNIKGLGVILAIIFAILCVLASIGGGCMFQSNQAFSQFSGEVPLLRGKGFIFGVILIILVGVVILGGIKSIARATEKIVPFMAGLYALAALFVLGYHVADIPKVIALILEGAMSPTAMKGGFLGVLIIGMQRASFSNEAGMGSAAIAPSAAKTDEPGSEGIGSLLEPVIDTVVGGTYTALVITCTGC